MDEDDLGIGATLVMGPFTPAVIDRLVKGLQGLLPPPAPAYTREQLDRDTALGDRPPPPDAPPGAGALPDVTNGARDQYRDMAGAAEAADAKVAELLQQYMASNEVLRSRISDRIKDLQGWKRTLLQHPEYLNQPDKMKEIGGHLDSILAQIQQLLERAKLSSAQQASVLGPLKDAYQVPSGRPGR